MRGSKRGTARTGAAYTPWKREQRDVGGGKPNRRENERTGKRKGEGSSKKEENQRSGKHEKQKRWSWRVKQTVGSLPEEEFLGGSALSRIMV